MMANEQRSRPSTGRRALARPMQGFTLIELSIVLIIIGIIISTVAAIAPRFIEGAERRENQAALERVEGAILDFAARYGRLPCPSATEDNGAEDCGGDDSGYVPFETIGLRDGDDRYGDHLRYGVYRGAQRSDLSGDELTFRGLGEFCLALRNAADESSPSDGGRTASLYITTRDSQSTLDTNVAFALASSGESGTFHGANSDGGDASTGVIFQNPSTSPADVDDYDDLVLANEFSQLSRALDCRSANRDARLEFATSSTLRTWVENNGYEDEILVDGGLLDREDPEGYHWCIEERTTSLDTYLSFDATMEGNGDEESVPVQTDDDRCTTDIDWAEGEYLNITENGDPFPSENRLSFRVFVRDRASGTSSGTVTDLDQEVSGTFNIPLEQDSD